MQGANANGFDKTRQGKLPPALNPEQPALTQPWRDFVSRGFITSIDVKFSGGTTSVAFELGPQVKTPDGHKREGIPAGMAKHYIIESGLWSPKASREPNGKKKDAVQLPKKSLVKSDLEGTTSDEALKARVAAVAAALTDTAARGRIGSLNFMRKGVDTFDKWWKNATPQNKTRLVMDGKHHANLTGDEHARFARVITACPFRGAVPTPSEEEEEPTPQAKPNGASSSPKRQ